MSQTKKGCRRINDARRALYLLTNLKMELTTEITSSGTTLGLKKLKLGGMNHKFIETYVDGKCVGRIDPFTLLALCDSTTFFTISDYMMREKMSAMLHIKIPEKLSVTGELLKHLIRFKLLTGYVEHDYKEQYGVEITPSLLQMFE